MPNPAPRLLPVAAVSTWIAVLAATIFLALGLRALFDPAGAAPFFGVALDAGPGLAFVQAFGARNIGLSLVALALIALDSRRGLIAVFFAAALIACLDFWIVAAQSDAHHAAKHLAYVAALAGFGFWFARRPPRSADDPAAQAA